MAEFFGQLATGITYGLILLLISTGLTVVFGIGRVVNFAHGAFYALGAFVGASAAIYAGWIGALIVAPVVVGLFALAVDVALLQRIRRNSEMMTLILTYGLLLIMTNVMRNIWGTAGYYVELPAAFRGFVEIFGVRVGRYQFVAAALALIAAGALLALLYRTPAGLKFRGAAADPETAEIVGISVERLFRRVFAAGSALAGFAGAVAAPLYGAVVGMEEIVIYAFVIVVIGGLGSLRGTIAASILVGIMTSVGSAYVAAWSNMLVFLLMLVVLIAEPRGIFREGRVLVG